eukprot:COSAG02_NODE_117_length_35386_cov_78.819163_6_plen_106_part_00
MPYITNSPWRRSVAVVAHSTATNATNRARQFCVCNGMRFGKNKRTRALCHRLSNPAAQFFFANHFERAHICAHPHATTRGAHVQYMYEIVAVVVDGASIEVEPEL